MNKYYITLVAILLLGAVYLIWQNSARPDVTRDATEPPGHGVTGDAKLNTDPFDVVVAYTGSGFATTSVTIRKGTRVRFLNDSNGEVWPASSIHPTHTLYPEKEPTDCLGSSFDSCAALARGEFFDFTFYYAGTWRFHDHLHAYHTGEIIVTE